jgi:hypothetical protein
VSVLVTAFIVVAMLIALAVARLGGAVVEKSRAGNAADLAAAGALARGRPVSDACAVARATAIDNDAQLLTCRGGAGIAEVTVALEHAQARARAAFDRPVAATGVDDAAESAMPYETAGSP